MRQIDVYMLPFMLKKRPIGTTIVIHQDTAPEDTSSDNEALESCCKDIIDAIHAQNPKKLAEALMYAREVMDNPTSVEDEEKDEE